MKKNPYQMLDVPRDATDEEIRQAHRARARETHPDAGGIRKEFEEVQFAKTLLLDHKRRRKYDATGDATEETPDTLHSAAASIMITFFDTKCKEYFTSVFNPACDPRKKNLIREFQGKVNQDMSAVNGAINQMKSAIEILKDMIKRTTPKGKNNLLVRHYNVEITRLSQEIDKAERRKEELTAALELSDKYGFRFDEIIGTMTWVAVSS